MVPAITAHTTKNTSNNSLENVKNRCNFWRNFALIFALIFRVYLLKGQVFDDHVAVSLATQASPDETYQQF